MYASLLSFCAPGVWSFLRDHRSGDFLRDHHFSMPAEFVVKFCLHPQREETSLRTNEEDDEL
jgi:hypothetical protein